MDATDARIIRAPIRRKRNEETLNDRIKLKKVLGLTVCSNAALDVSPVSGLLAYPAGCTVVLFNAKRNTQAYLVNTSRKAFTAVTFSRCGRYLATGECGINPAIKVWELDAPNGNLEQATGGNVVAEFVDHKYSVTCVAFSPTGKYLVSVGSQHDMIVNVFDWKSNLKVASNKISSKVSAVSFSEDGSYFVTVGNRHVKYWYLKGGRKYDPVPLMGRSAILGDLRDNEFCAVACGKGQFAESTYAITRQGHLVEFSSRRLLDKWVQCRTTSANCLCVNSQFILVGCAESIIRIFHAATLEYVTTLPRTHYLGVDVAQGIHINHIMSPPQQAKFPDCIAMVFDEQRSKVCCVYNDHSLYIWDLRDIKRVGKSHSFLYHSTCIWGVETVPYNMERDFSYTLPEESFVTCSSDDTIRVWGLDSCINNDIYRRNIYSKDLLKVVYIDEELNYIKDQESLGEKSAANSTYDGRNGVRCIKINPDLQHLASGDRSGNIRIYNLTNLKLLTMIEAHESEVLCLEYSNEKIERKLLASASRDRLIHVFDVSQNYLLLQTIDDHSSSITSIKFVGAGLNFQMISCGADKSIMFRTFQGNIFSRGTNTFGKTTLYDMEVDLHAKHILTACQDRNIRIYSTQNSKHTKTYKGSASDEGSLIKLSLDPSGIYVATSCTDKTLAVYDCYSYECMARMYGHSELVTGLKFTNDCRHLISASGDGCIFVWQMPHDMIITMQTRLSQQRLRSGHAPLPRPLSAAPTDGIVVESKADGTEFVSPKPYVALSPSVLNEEDPQTPGFKWSDVGQLPQWAKRKAAAAAEADNSVGALAIPESSGSAMQPASSVTNLSSSPSQLSVPRARGRWAQRSQIDPDALTDLRANSESPLGPLLTTRGSTQTSDYNSASSKDLIYSQAYLSEDSSIDSGMENRRELKFIGSTNTGTVSNASSGSAGPTMSNLRQTTEKRKSGIRFETLSNDHDGDIEDISDGERTSSDHGIFYNNISPGTPTDFKVTAMNEDELRKSMRRQKFEKTGLSVGANDSTHTASTGTGTGTSDTEDEGSTPSAENAERSLASTLGGSSESIPQATTSSFLQAALPDGPGILLERGSTNRRSISAKHNTEKSPSNALTITKSYTSTKKEELLKVINEAKQKLENVGYRSLRGSHSISDLSLAGNLDAARNAYLAANRYTKPEACNKPSQSIRLTAQQQAPAAYAAHATSLTASQCQTQQNFFNCAASKTVLQQNCQAMRQVQQQYPPYPHHVGVHQIHPPPGVPFRPPPQQHVQNPASSVGPVVHTKPASSRVRRNPLGNTRRTPSILKHYKSCPVSPVHEEVEWSADNKSVIITEPKRHSVYADDARSILDMIHSDTEKMIEEITKKYGDMDDISVDVYDGTKGVRRPLKVPPNGKTAFLAQQADLSSSGSGGHTPKRAVSEYYVYQEVFHRKVSLSDILQDNPEQMTEARRLADARFLETQRHSSASFFLTSPFADERSQDSLVSNEFLDEASYCNSLESILSDESECKSATSENLVDTAQLQRHTELRNFIIHGPVGFGQMVTKSYGNSPNSYGSFDYYMQQRHMQTTPYSSPYQSFDGEQLKVISNSQTYPRLAAQTVTETDDIPTLSSKNKQYNASVTKSLSQDFAQQRRTISQNAREMDQQKPMFARKTPIKYKPPIPTKPLKLVSTLTSTVEGRGSRTANVVRKFENNLKKFEKEKEVVHPSGYKINNNMRNSVSSGALSSTTHSCLKKTSKFDEKSSRRATSVRSRARPKISVRFNTVSQIKYTPSEKRATATLNDIKTSKKPQTAEGEKSFEMYIAENGNEIEESMQMNSLKLYTKPKMPQDGVKSAAKRGKSACTEAKTQTNLAKIQGNDTNSTTYQCKNIARKIDIIEKLIAMEECKLEKIRLAAENRMRPFACNSKEKGYVKSLTMNFDMLAKGVDKDVLHGGKDCFVEYDMPAATRIKRNVSLPDVLESTDMRSYLFEKTHNPHNYVEMAKEVKTDADVEALDDEEMKTNSNTDMEHESEKMRLESSEKEEGAPKSLLPMPIEESSIRRACSLSDLYMGNMNKGGKSPGPLASKSNVSHRNNSTVRSANKRNSLQFKNSSGSLLVVPSTSMGVLNQASDSETEEANRVSRTASSSQTRSNGTVSINRGYGNKTPTTNGNRRKVLPVTFNNSSTQQDDSSSEETPNNTANSKPVVPPRPRNLSFDQKTKFINSNLQKQHNSNNNNTSVTSDNINNDTGEGENIDAAQAQVHNVINKLYTTTQTVMQLHANLKNCEESLMLKELENAVIMTQNMLTNITQNKINDKNITNNSSSAANNNNNSNSNNNHNNNNNSSTNNSVGITKGSSSMNNNNNNLNNNNEQSNLDNGEYVKMVNNCADLLSNFRWKQHKTDDCEQNS